MRQIKVKHCDTQALELALPQGFGSGWQEAVQRLLSDLGAEIMSFDCGVDRWQWQFRWQDTDYVLFAEQLVEAIWIEAGRVVTAPEDLAMLQQAIRRIRQ
ncbi:hypothetical protein HMF8227_02912 [Saliniradius amylolyticus]|uniref:DUF3630 family protein n=1 Tax=Saliniradius amylolyticus TaxID=2183582 RepID=A0A2S2E828_9ALTE|nr:DUF3630 family protein [Saliniradius amylolyticus]AWL13360.1 hypothetical protein HMF8227_02912 [Saliniradius amylolyticus]